MKITSNIFHPLDFVLNFCFLIFSYMILFFAVSCGCIKAKTQFEVIKFLEGLLSARRHPKYATPFVHMDIFADLSREQCRPRTNIEGHNYKHLCICTECLYSPYLDSSVPVLNRLCICPVLSCLIKRTGSRLHESVYTLEVSKQVNFQRKRFHHLR